MSDPTPQAIPDDASHFAVHRGHRIHYTLDGSGPLVVLQHGALGDAGDWAATGFIAELTDAFTVASVDSLAHGRSDKPADSDLYELRQRAGDLVAVMDDLGQERAHVIGYSMGGWIASGVALHFPERLASLTIGGWDVEGGLETAARGLGVDVFTFDFLRNVMASVLPEKVAWITPEVEPAVRASFEASGDVEGTAAAVARLRVPVGFWNGRGDANHEPMQAFAAKHHKKYVSVAGDHVLAFRVHGAEAARQIRAEVLEA